MQNLGAYRFVQSQPGHPDAITIPSLKSPHNRQAALSQRGFATLTLTRSDTHHADANQ